MIDPDGSNLRKVGDVFAASAASPAWSPAPAADGSHKIAYVDSLQSSGTPDEIFLVNVDGTAGQQLTNTPGVFFNDLTWSPDAGTLAATATDLNEYDVVLFDLGLVDDAVAVTGETNLTSEADVPGGLLNDAVYIANVSWGKVGGKLVLAAGPSVGKTDIWVIDLSDASHPVQVTDTPEYFEELGPTWSPDDSRILFYESFWTGKVYVMDADGSNLEELASEKGYRSGRVGRPNWRRNP